MDYKKVLNGLGQSIGIFVILLLFVMLLAIVMMSLGPHAPPSQKMTCDIVNATTFCHF
jgi:hypothetical protein